MSVQSRHSVREPSEHGIWKWLLSYVAAVPVRPNKILVLPSRPPNQIAQQPLIIRMLLKIPGPMRRNIRQISQRSPFSNFTNRNLRIPVIRSNQMGILPKISPIIPQKMILPAPINPLNHRVLRVLNPEHISFRHLDPIIRPPGHTSYRKQHIYS